VACACELRSTEVGGEVHECAGDSGDGDVVAGGRVAGVEVAAAGADPGRAALPALVTSGAGGEPRKSPRR
jgi:hypothetical protein